MKKIKRLLIANRGEVVATIIRTARELGIETVAVYEKPDEEAPFVRFADQAVLIGNGPVKDYLDIGKIIETARKSGADAVHPGYGFLAENSDLSEACEEKGIIFVGPPPRVMRALGNKVRAKEIAGKAGLPFIPGIRDLSPGEAAVDEALAFAREQGYPFMLKAVAGGGGRGIRKVEKEGDLRAELLRARHEALLAFNDDGIYIEKYLESPRHVEVQILADQFGRVMHLGTRDCSIQRRHQKLLQSAPAVLPPETLAAMHAMAVRVSREAGYVGAGTVEFLVDPRSNEFWFMEINTRLQVEYTITELITGVDIVKQQILIAEGAPLDLPDRINFTGHAIQVRINAEDPGNHFMPEGGKRIDCCRVPEGPFIRVDGVLYPGYRIPPAYDSLLAKLSVKGCQWDQTVQRLKGALRNFTIIGPRTTIPFYLAVCDEPDFRKGNFDTCYLERHPDILARLAGDAGLIRAAV